MLWVGPDGIRGQQAPSNAGAPWRLEALGCFRATSRRSDRWRASRGRLCAGSIIAHRHRIQASQPMFSRIRILPAKRSEEGYPYRHCTIYKINRRQPDLAPHLLLSAAKHILYISTHWHESLKPGYPQFGSQAFRILEKRQFALLSVAKKSLNDSMSQRILPE